MQNNCLRLSIKYYNHSDKSYLHTYTTSSYIPDRCRKYCSDPYTYHIPCCRSNRLCCGFGTPNNCLNLNVRYRIRSDKLYRRTYTATYSIPDRCRNWYSVPYIYRTSCCRNNHHKYRYSMQNNHFHFDTMYCIRSDKPYPHIYTAMYSTPDRCCNWYSVPYTYRTSDFRKSRCNCKYCKTDNRQRFDMKYCNRSDKKNLRTYTATYSILDRYCNWYSVPYTYRILYCRIDRWS